MSRRRGITLLELIVALTMSIFVIMAAASAYTTAITFDRQHSAQLALADARARFEGRLRQLLRGAYVSATANDSMTYFLGIQSGNGITATAADQLIFTCLNEGMNGLSLNSDDDFETLNQTYGAQGGIAEIALSTTPTGDQGQSKSGLFLREQRPADGDPTQGGNESVFDPDVKSIQFEFYNGTDWDPTWSTSGLNAANIANLPSAQNGEDGRRIPAAIRVTYTLSGDPEGTQHMFIVRLPNSDVTAENPIVITGGGQ